MNEIQKEKDDKIKEQIEIIDDKIRNIINEKNSIWDNCFNKYINKNYSYNFDDMEKIVKFNSKKYQIFNNSYYISDFDTIENINNAKKALKNGKIVFGNFNENNFWNSFFIIPNNNSNYFLYKSSDGKIPSEKLKDYINQITNNNYVIKIIKTMKMKKMNYQKLMQ
jgi:hypothetical protein